VKRSTIALLLSSTIALAACGESQEDKARAKVCDARADISKQVDQLQGFTLATATVDGVSANLKAIREDLGEIADAQADLNDDRRAQVQAANKAFSAQVTSIAQNVGKSLSVADAETQIKASLTQLADSYTQTLGRIDCG
jgi:phosphoglycerate-specific signal transduction histidine kinase